MGVVVSATNYGQFVYYKTTSVSVDSYCIFDKTTVYRCPILTANSFGAPVYMGGVHSSNLYPNFHNFAIKLYRKS